MKKLPALHLSRMLLILLVTLIVIPSCKKDKGDEDEDPTPDEAIISFKVNGVQKTFDMAWFSPLREGSNYVLFMTGVMTGNGRAYFSMKITSSSPIKEMNYGNDTGATRSIEFTDTDGTIYQSVSGPANTIDVDKKSDTRVEGTFSGSVAGPGGNATITDGVFRCDQAL